MDRQGGLLLANHVLRTSSGSLENFDVIHANLSTKVLTPLFSFTYIIMEKFFFQEKNVNDIAFAESEETRMYAALLKFFKFAKDL